VYSFLGFDVAAGKKDCVVIDDRSSDAPAPMRSKLPSLISLAILRLTASMSSVELGLSRCERMCISKTGSLFSFSVDQNSQPKSLGEKKNASRFPSSARKFLALALCESIVHHAFLLERTDETNGVAQWRPLSCITRRPSSRGPSSTRAARAGQWGIPRRVVFVFVVN
jgi:hypothetical protein